MADIPSDLQLMPSAEQPTAPAVRDEAYGRHLPPAKEPPTSFERTNRSSLPFPGELPPSGLEQPQAPREATERWNDYRNPPRFDNPFQHLERAAYIVRNHGVEFARRDYELAINAAVQINQTQVRIDRTDNMIRLNQINRQLSGMTRAGYSLYEMQELVQERDAAIRNERKLYVLYLSPAITRANAGLALIRSGTEENVRQGERLLALALKLRPEIEGDENFRRHLKDAYRVCTLRRHELSGPSEPPELAGIQDPEPRKLEVPRTVPANPENPEKPGKPEVPLSSDPKDPSTSPTQPGTEVPGATDDPASGGKAQKGAAVGSTAGAGASGDDSYSKQLIQTIWNHPIASLFVGILGYQLIKKGGKWVLERNKGAAATTTKEESKSPDAKKEEDKKPEDKNEGESPDAKKEVDKKPEDKNEGKSPDAKREEDKKPEDKKDEGKSPDAKKEEDKKPEDKKDEGKSPDGKDTESRKNHEQLASESKAEMAKEKLAGQEFQKDFSQSAKRELLPDLKTASDPVAAGLLVKQFLGNKVGEGLEADFSGNTKELFDGLRVEFPNSVGKSELSFSCNGQNFEPLYIDGAFLVDHQGKRYPVEGSTPTLRIPANRLQSGGAQLVNELYIGGLELRRLSQRSGVASNETPQTADSRIEVAKHQLAVDKTLAADAGRLMGKEIIAGASVAETGKSAAATTAGGKADSGWSIELASVSNEAIDSNHAIIKIGDKSIDVSEITSQKLAEVKKELTEKKEKKAELKRIVRSGEAISDQVADLQRVEKQIDELTKKQNYLERLGRGDLDAINEFRMVAEARNLPSIAEKIEAYKLGKEFDGATLEHGDSIHGKSRFFFDTTRLSAILTVFMVVAPSLAHASESNKE